MLPESYVHLLSHTSCRSYRMASAVILFKILFLTNTFHGVEETTLAPAVTYRDECQTVLPALNNSDPFFFVPQKAKLGQKIWSREWKMIITKPIAQALFEQSDNDSSVIFTTVILLPVFILSWFRPVVYCELVQSGYYVDIVWKRNITSSETLWQHLHN